MIQNMDYDTILGFFLIMMWALASLQIAKRYNYFSLTAHPATYGKEPSSHLVFIAFFLFMAIQVISERYFSKHVWKEPLAIIASYFAVRGMLHFFPEVKKGIFRSNAFSNFAFGAMTWLICYPLVMLLDHIISTFLLLFFGRPPVDQLAVEIMKGYLDNPYQFWIIALLIIIAVPVIEELLFRGFLQTRLKKAIGLRYSIILTSLIFTLFHFSPNQGVYNISILSALFMLSLFLGFIYERQNSLLAPIGLHCTFNAFSIGMIFFTSTL